MEVPSMYVYGLRCQEFTNMIVKKRRIIEREIVMLYVTSISRGGSPLYPRIGLSGLWDVFVFCKIAVDLGFVFICFILDELFDCL